MSSVNSMNEYCEIPKFSKERESLFLAKELSTDELKQRGFDNARIYIKKPCPFCDKAISLLEDHHIPYTIIDLTDDPELRQKIAKSQGDFPTVPMIFLNEKFVGGCDDLIAALKKAEL